MGESYAKRAMREGPLPKADEDSELVGENNDKGIPESEDAAEVEATENEQKPYFVTLPAPGSGSFPMAAPRRIKRDDEG